MIVYAAVITTSNVERQRYFFNTREEAEKALMDLRRGTVRAIGI